MVCADTDAVGAFALCRLVRTREVPLRPLLLVIEPKQIDDLQLREDLFDDFCVLPATPEEIAARLAHLFWRTGRGLHAELIEYGPLVLNLETYQAAVAGKVLDLTFMEYELLRFLAARPGQGLHPRDAAQPGLGLRVLRRRPHRRRPRPPPAGQARRGARPPDRDRPLRRLPLRPRHLDPLVAPAPVTTASARHSGK